MNNGITSSNAIGPEQPYIDMIREFETYLIGELQALNAATSFNTSKLTRVVNQCVAYFNSAKAGTSAAKSATLNSKLIKITNECTDELYMAVGKSLMVWYADLIERQFGLTVKSQDILNAEKDCQNIVLSPSKRQLISIDDRKAVTENCKVKIADSYRNVSCARNAKEKLSPKRTANFDSNAPSCVNSTCQNQINIAFLPAF